MSAGWIALLRGINVGSKNRITMAALTDHFERAGAREVQTFIQSGNLLFEARAAAAVAAKVERSLAEAGLETPVVLRTADELAGVIAAPAFDDVSTMHVMFLRDAPGKPQVSALDPQRSPGDAFVVRGRELYVSFAAGAGKTKLTNAYVDRVLGTVSTMRNWRTVLALGALASGRWGAPRHGSAPRSRTRR